MANLIVMMDVLSEQSVAFPNEIVRILTKSSVIPLFVALEDNYNISVQLKKPANEKLN